MSASESEIQVGDPTELQLVRETFGPRLEPTPRTELALQLWVAGEMTDDQLAQVMAEPVQTPKSE